jgi:O-antigen/teichoic acid export membrane protein
MMETRTVDVSAAGPPAAPRLRHVPNAVSAVVLFAARLLAVVLQLRIVDKHWGGAFTGLNALSNQVLLYVTLLELGLSQSAITLLYEPLLKRDYPRVCGMISALRHDVRMLALGGSILIVPGLVLYARFIRGPLPYFTVLGTVACVAAAGFVQLMAIHFQAYLNAAEQLDKVNYTFAGGYLLKSGIGLLLALHWNNYLLLPAATAMLSLAEFTALKMAFHRAFADFRPVPWREPARALRSRAKYVLIQRVAGVAYYQSDFIILSLTTSLAVVKDYAKFQYVSAALLSVVGLVAASLTTSVARMQLRHHAENRRRQYATAQMAISIIGAVLMLAFWFTARNVVSFVFGGDPDVSTESIVLFGAALFLNIVKAADDVFIMAKGAFEVGWWIPATEVPVYVITGVVLSRYMGFNGILLASIGTNLAVSIVLKGIVLSGPVFDCTRAQWYKSRFTGMAKAFVAAVPLAAVYVLAPRFVHPMSVRFIVTNVIGVAYMVGGIRWIVSRN